MENLLVEGVVAPRHIEFTPPDQSQVRIRLRSSSLNEPLLAGRVFVRCKSASRRPGLIFSCENTAIVYGGGTAEEVVVNVASEANLEIIAVVPGFSPTRVSVGRGAEGVQINLVPEPSLAVVGEEPPSGKNAVSYPTWAWLDGFQHPSAEIQDEGGLGIYGRPPFVLTSSSHPEQAFRVGMAGFATRELVSGKVVRRVVDEASKEEVAVPLVGVYVSCAEPSDSSYHYYALSDSAGSFTVPCTTEFLRLRAKDSVEVIEFTSKDGAIYLPMAERCSLNLTLDGAGVPTGTSLVSMHSTRLGYRWNPSAVLSRSGKAETLLGQNSKYILASVPDLGSVVVGETAEVCNSVRPVAIRTAPVRGNIVLKDLPHSQTELHVHAVPASRDYGGSRRSKSSKAPVAVASVRQDGSFQFKNLKNGRYVLVVVSETLTSQSFGPFDVIPGSELPALEIVCGGLASGRVLNRETGDPEAAEVVLRPTLSPDFPRTTSADLSGLFSLDCVDPRQAFDVLVTKKGFAPFVGKDYYAGKDLEVALEPAYPLKLRVVGDAELDGTERLRVLENETTVHQAPVVRDEEFTIEGTPAGSYSVIVEGEAVYGYKEIFHPTEGVHDVELVPALSLSGRVTSVDGEPVEGARIGLRSRHRRSSARTNVFGNFSFTGLMVGDYRLSWRHSDYIPGDRHLAMHRTTMGLQVELQRGGQVSGVVRPFAGRVSGTSIHCLDESSTGPGQRVSVAREDGVFSCAGLSGPTVRLVAKGPSGTADLAGIQTGSTNVRVDLVPSIGSIEARVEGNPNGDSRFAASVTAVPANPYLYSLRRELQFSSELGAFVATDLSLGDWVVRVEGPGLSQTLSNVNLTFERPLRRIVFQAEEGPSMRRQILSRSGEPLRNFLIWVVPEETGSGVRLRSDSSGYISIEGLRGGRYRYFQDGNEDTGSVGDFVHGADQTGPLVVSP